MEHDDRETGASTDLPTQCTNCNDRLESDEWHPTESVDSDGEVQAIRVFCDEECHSKWHARRTGQATE
jgi:hypothetical protein